MKPASAPVTPDLSREIVTAAHGHLSRIVLPQGRFVYAHEAGDVTAAHDGYNLLRHCGTLWFMARALTETPMPSDPDTIAALARASGYICRKLEPAPWADPRHPSLALVGKGAVKLGGLGLALLALAEAKKIVPLQASLSGALALGPDETIARMRRYALDEIDGDDFRHKRDVLTGTVLPFRSDYYTGEAIFGLLMAGPTTEALTRATTALMTRGYGWAEQSHWMAYASCEAIERGVVTEALGRDYLTGLVAGVLTVTAYRDRRESTPIACRSEALSRILLLSRARPGYLDADLMSRANDHLAADLETQLDWYKEGQFWKGDTSDKVQIDYIQHNATGFLQWLRLQRDAL